MTVEDFFSGDFVSGEYCEFKPNWKPGPGITLTLFAVFKFVKPRLGPSMLILNAWMA